MDRIESQACKLEILVEAACHYTLVMDLLCIIHDMRNGRPIDADSAALFDTASTAALLASAERLRQGIDHE